VALDEHVLLRALALGLPVWEVLYVTFRSTFRSRRWALDFLAGRSYVLLRSTFGVRAIPCVTLRSTFALQGWPTQGPARSRDKGCMTRVLFSAASVR